MAYMSQTKKNEINELVKLIMAKYKMKYTLAVRHHSTLVVNITKGELDLVGDNVRDDTRSIYHLNIDRSYPKNTASYEFLSELVSALNSQNHDKSDVMTDYFDVGYYVEINVGKHDKPYILIGGSKK